LVYPNPFAPTLAVDKVLKFDNIPVRSRIRIFTVTGELVWEKSDVGGRVQWDGTNQGGSAAVSGIYIYLVDLENGEKITGKIFLTRWDGE
jgi:hypothetical protein